ncbi:MAG: tRNA (adenosine(37)-N6)-dimethylallyltransferase MiaA [Chloroflexota bacterium]
MNSKPHVLVIGGPTASGKTRLAIELAKSLGGEIVSADSRQIYKYMDIGTAKATAEERAEAFHHLVDFLEPKENYSAGQFAKDAVAKIKEILNRGAFPIVCGGTGLYIEALTEGLRESEDPDPGIRAFLNNLYAERGKEGLVEYLAERDAQALEMYPDRNPARLIRALEYCLSTGRKFSEGIGERRKEGDFNFLMFGPDIPRETLYERINARAEAMWSGGLIEETERLLAMGVEEGTNALNTVGYKEAVDYIKGRNNGGDALEQMKRNTRRYAKRQMTWFRNRGSLTFMSGEGGFILKNILGIVKKLI